uniref:Uncharacterized protein n=1 Tax=Rhizophora mucronata TaxID=61149 RepID=A0A2P2QJF5_RHIMU
MACQISDKKCNAGVLSWGSFGILTISLKNLFQIQIQVFNCNMQSCTVDTYAENRIPNKN